MRAWFLKGFNNRKLREQEVPTPTKKFINLLHRALKLAQQAKKEKSKHRRKFESSTNESIEIKKSSSSFLESSEDDRKKKNKGSWLGKIDDMSRRTFEIFGLRGSSRKVERWCTKCKAKNHTAEGCTQCCYCKAFGHEWTNCKIIIHHLKEGKGLSMIGFVSMDPVPATTEQPQQTASASTSGYNGKGRGRGRGGNGNVDFKRNFNYYKCGKGEGQHHQSLIPRLKELGQSKSIWKEKGKAKEFNEWKDQRELVVKITENPEKKKPKDLECSKARSVHRIPVAVIKALLLETQNVGTGSVPIDSFEDNCNFENEQDEIEIQMCQRIQQLTIEPACFGALEQQKLNDDPVIEDHEDDDDDDDNNDDDNDDDKDDAPELEEAHDANGNPVNRKSKQSQNVFKSPASDMYIIFGEAKIEDLSSQLQIQAVEQFKAPAHALGVSKAEPSTTYEADEDEVDEAGEDQNAKPSGGGLFTSLPILLNGNGIDKSAKTIGGTT
ncbi:hypothetical protein L7F22_011567 [Adiantum nelumboides]|nr:hypothetical protein [Adiantum nelumboides]